MHKTGSCYLMFFSSQLRVEACDDGNPQKCTGSLVTITVLRNTSQPVCNYPTGQIMFNNAIRENISVNSVILDFNASFSNAGVRHGSRSFLLFRLRNA